MCGLILKKFDLFYLGKSEEWLSDPYTKRMTCANDLTYEQRLKWFDTIQLREDYKIWGLEYDDVPIGVCGLKNIIGLEGEYFGYIGERGYRGKGLGEAMMNQVFVKAREFGLSLIKLDVLHENIPAISLYSKMGFMEYQSDEKFKQMKKYI